MNTHVTLLHQVLSLACEGSCVTFRELFTTLSQEEIQAIKAGEIGIDDLKEIVNDLADSKQNTDHYKVPMRNNQSQETEQFKEDK